MWTKDAARQGGQGGGGGALRYVLAEAARCETPPQLSCVQSVLPVYASRHICSSDLILSATATAAAAAAVFGGNFDLDKKRGRLCWWL